MPSLTSRPSQLAWSQIAVVFLMPNKLKPSLDWLLALVPVAFLLAYWPAMHNDTALFICSGLAIIPLAGIMGRATEHLSEHLGQSVGGLLNATFGNAAELIIALMALHKGSLPRDAQTVNDACQLVDRYCARAWVTTTDLASYFRVFAWRAGEAERHDSQTVWARHALQDSSPRPRHGCRGF